METPIFKDNFLRWEEDTLKSQVIEAKTKPDRAEVHSNIFKTVTKSFQVDVAALIQGATAEATRQMSIDDGSGSVKVWRVEDFKLVDWPEDKYGHFYAGDSYVIKYSYVKSGKNILSFVLREPRRQDRNK